MITTNKKIKMVNDVLKNVTIKFILLKFVLNNWSKKKKNNRERIKNK